MQFSSAESICTITDENNKNGKISTLLKMYNDVLRYVEKYKTIMSLFVMRIFDNISN